MTELPPVAACLAYSFGAWIVGSGAEVGVDFSKLRDLDIMVPFHAWPLAACIIPKNATPNTYGGWKVQAYHPVDNHRLWTVDIWPDDIGRLFLNDRCTVAWHPKTGVRIRKD